jgi:hypothetical protein
MPTAPRVRQQPQQPPEEPPKPTEPPTPPPETEDPTVLIERDRTPERRPLPEKKPEPTATRKLDTDYILCGLSGEHAGKRFPIDAEEFSVGRDRSCDLVIHRDEKGRPDTAISRHHFTVIYREGQLFLRDSRSQLRTYVNDKVIEPDQEEAITHDDIISIPSPQGEIRFRVCYADDPNFSDDKAGGFPWLWVIGLLVLIALLVFAWFYLLGGD